MSYLLDTNAWVNYLRGGKRSPIATKLRTVNSNDVYTCSVVRAELIYGALRSNEIAKNLGEAKRLLSGFQSLPFNDAASDHCASMRSELDAAGLKIGPYDAMIAAIAIATGMTLVTHNIREFSRVPGLQIEDWQTT
jgi:tRNA(fMet)-specific endonuclease VapC